MDRREFRETLKQYRNHTKRDLATILNTKGFYIARGCARETPKADIAQMNAEIGVQAMALVRHQKGPRAGMHMRGNSARIYAQGSTVNAPLLALIINARRGRAGQPGLYGAAMRQEMGKVLTARARSIAFIKSGWLPAIKVLARYAENKTKAARPDPKAKQYGKSKGAAYPAIKDAWVQRTIIENSATTTRDKKQALYKYAWPTFQREWAKEIASMKSYIARKLQDGANKINARR